jgi:hypothetical protein
MWVFLPENFAAGPSGVKTGRQDYAMPWPKETRRRPYLRTPFDTHRELVMHLHITSTLLHICTRGNVHKQPINFSSIIARHQGAFTVDVMHSNIRGDQKCVCRVVSV